MPIQTRKYSDSVNLHQAAILNLSKVVFHAKILLSCCQIWWRYLKPRAVLTLNLTRSYWKYRYLVIYTVFQKSQALKLFTVTSSNLNRF